jgi:hypothetical protein
LIQVDTSVNFYITLPPQWSSDTSFIYGASDSCLVEYFIYSRRTDTLITLHNYNRISSFAYNVKEYFLAYSINQYHSNPPQLYFHFKESLSDFLAFSPFRDDSDSGCWSSPMQIRFLSWSPDNDRLGFVPLLGTNPGSGVYFYFLDSNRTYKTTICEDIGVKFGLTWANQDTLVYWDKEDDHLYGIDIVPVIDAIQAKTNKPTATNFSIGNYPNPFNPTTTIAITLPRSKDGVLSIYDIQGRLLKEYKIRNNGATDYRITWNALNNQGVNIASGFYLAVLRIDDPPNQNRKIAKLIYLK